MTTPLSFTHGLTDLRRILHNLDDHTQVLQTLFASGGLADPFRARLMTHIRHEEAENHRQLCALQDVPGLPDYVLSTLIQHSQLLVDLTTDQESEPKLVAEILHHFSEEHQWFAETLSSLAEGEPSPTAAAPPQEGSQPRRLTVGSLVQD
jgi:hypothetical protein